MTLIYFCALCGGYLIKWGFGGKKKKIKDWDKCLIWDCFDICRSLMRDPLGHFPESTGEFQPFNDNVSTSALYTVAERDVRLYIGKNRHGISKIREALWVIILNDDPQWLNLPPFHLWLCFSAESCCYNVKSRQPTVGESCSSSHQEVCAAETNTGAIGFHTSWWKMSPNPIDGSKHVVTVRTGIWEALYYFKVIFV